MLFSETVISQRLGTQTIAERTCSPKASFVSTPGLYHKQKFLQLVTGIQRVLKKPSVFAFIRGEIFFDYTRCNKSYEEKKMFNLFKKKEKKLTPDELKMKTEPGELRNLRVYCS